MPLILVFLLGIANFAMHKAVLESGHPLLVHLPGLFRSTGGWFGFGFEFLLLTGTMLMVADAEAFGWTWGYAAYSALNGVSAWLILSRRL